LGHLVGVWNFLGLGILGGKFREGVLTYFHRKLGHEVENCVLGEFLVSTLIYEENLIGGIRIYSF
jgi:hypothetical protein